MQAVAYSINIGGHLLCLDAPIVMGILNATPDSFFMHHEGAEAIAMRVRQMLAEGAKIVDVGACSTRPGFVPPDEQEEMRRLREALTIVRKEAPDAVVSVDTFRANVAKMCVEEFGIQIINDISGGSQDADMFNTVASLGVPYVLTHNAVIDATDDAPFMAQLLRDMGSKAEKLHEMGVCDVILDPGFGFGKTLEQNYTLLVGVSHKSMIYKMLGTTPDEALNGTTVLHTTSLMKGAHILRAHEVKEAMECIKIVSELNRK